jgi:hypothetical protein
VVLKHKASPNGVELIYLRVTPEDLTEEVILAHLTKL